MGFFSGISDAISGVTKGIAGVFLGGGGGGNSSSSNNTKTTTNITFDNKEVANAINNSNLVMAKTSNDLLQVISTSNKNTLSINKNTLTVNENIAKTLNVLAKNNNKSIDTNKQVFKSLLFLGGATLSIYAYKQIKRGK